MVLAPLAARAVERQPCFRAALQALPVTALLTYGGTLWACAALFVAEGPHGGVHRFVIFANISLSGPVNFTALWEDCATGLCDISEYGGWPEGREHAVFRAGFTALAVQLLALVVGRLGLLHVAAPRELRQGVCTACCPHTAADRLCSPLLLGAVAATLAIAALLPMAWIPFYTSMFHFLSAAVTFIALAVAQAADALVQLRILRRGAGQPADGGAGCGGCLEGLGTEAQLLLCYNAFFASFGLLCFVAWLLLGLTLAEWLAATAPFFYFLPFGFQVTWLHGMSSQGTYAALLSDAAAADSALVSPLAPGAPERSAGGGGAGARR